MQQIETKVDNSKLIITIPIKDLGAEHTRCEHISKIEWTYVLFGGGLLSLLLMLAFYIHQAVTEKAEQ